MCGRFRKVVVKLGGRILRGGGSNDRMCGRFRKEVVKLCGRDKRVGQIHIYIYFYLGYRGKKERNTSLSYAAGTNQFKKLGGGMAIKVRSCSLEGVLEGGVALG